MIKIAMDSTLIPLYRLMIMTPCLQIQPGPNLRYPPSEQEDRDIINALYKILTSLNPPPRFCKLPCNETALKDHPIDKEKFPDCCRKGFDTNKINNVNIRMDELKDFQEKLAEECRLLAEAEVCGVNILLARNRSFNQNLQNRAKNKVKIFHPIDYSNEIAK
jgi:hypothetical protein